MAVSGEADAGMDSYGRESTRFINNNPAARTWGRLDRRRPGETVSQDFLAWQHEQLAQAVATSAAGLAVGAVLVSDVSFVRQMVG